MSGIAIKTKREEKKMESVMRCSSHSVQERNLSEKPDALAYTYETQAEIAPGQENCLSHELGRAVQQKLGIVRANAMHSGAPAGDGIVQRQLFIRRTPDMIYKGVDEMRTKAKVTRKKTEKQPRSLIRKIPQYLNGDSGYFEITEELLPAVMLDYDNWLNRIGKPRLEKEEVSIVVKKIKSMIDKEIDSADPEDVFDMLTDERLPKGTTMVGSYYFDSVYDFYKYIDLYRKKLSVEPDNLAGQPRVAEIDTLDHLYDMSGLESPEIINTWLKINVVNTGAGDAIVMTLPEGYLIVDLGTNLNILLNYLALRKNKHDGTESGSRGIPLTGEKTCIVITHGDVDHKGCKEGFQYNKNELLQNVIIGYKQYCGAKAAQDDKYKKLMKLLRSGMFHVCDFSPSKSSKPNRDSLVITRKLGESEAVILCGDQEPKRLNEALDTIYYAGDAENMGPGAGPVDHLFVKVPHHGSYENNDKSIMNGLSVLGAEADLVVSSGALYQHPTAGVFSNENRLYRQGTELSYPAYIPEDGEKDDSLSEFTGKSRVFYTQNLSARPSEFTLGSVVYKSDGEDHVTYSKCYTDPNKPIIIPNSEEVEDKQDSQGIIPEDSFEKKKKFLYYMSQKDPSLIINQEFQDIIPYIFYTMEAEQQVLYLCSFNNANNINQFLDSLDIERLKLEEVEPWKDLICKIWCTDINWGQNFFNIMVQTCQDETLTEAFEPLLNIEYHCLRDKFLTAVIAYGKQPHQYVEMLIEWIKNNDMPENIEIATNVINKLLHRKECFSDDLTLEELQDQVDLLELLPPVPQIVSFISYLANKSLKSNQFMVVFQYLTDTNALGEEIFSMCTPPFFLELMHRYPEHCDDIYTVYEQISEDEGLPTLAVLNSEYTWDSVEELTQKLAELDIDFITFTGVIMQEAFKTDIEGENIYFWFAYEHRGEHPEYLTTLFEICHSYDNSNNDYLRCYMQSLVEKDMQCLTNLLTQWDLNPSVAGECWYLLILEHPEIIENMDELIANNTIALKKILLRPWKKTITKEEFIQPRNNIYNYLAQNNPERMVEIFVKHFMIDKEIAECILIDMENDNVNKSFLTMDFEQFFDVIKDVNEKCIEKLKQLWNV